MSEDVAKRLAEMWEDQRAFNLLLRREPASEEEQADQIRDFVLFTGSEMHELLRALPWKKHRKLHVARNQAHIEEEGIDTFKCVLSILQIIGIKNWEHLIEAYWRKTAVVRQRYREEWTQKIDGPCVIIDIDNVICDYISGMIDWLEATQAISPQVIASLRRDRPHLNHGTVCLPSEHWSRLKHEFRITGIKRMLPVFPDAYTFLFRMRADGYRIVLLTSRPIDRYPNIFTDTIMWLNDNQLPYDFVWWSHDKAERIIQVQDIKQHILFAVDDDWQFVEQFADLGIETYWLQRHNSPSSTTREDVIVATSLEDVPLRY